jgi:hypothetical protein
MEENNNNNLKKRKNENLKSEIDLSDYETQIHHWPAPFTIQWDDKEWKIFLSASSTKGFPFPPSFTKNQNQRTRRVAIEILWYLQGKRFCNNCNYEGFLLEFDHIKGNIDILIYFLQGGGRNHREGKKTNKIWICSICNENEEGTGSNIGSWIVSPKHKEKANQIIQLLCLDCHKKK